MAHKEWVRLANLDRLAIKNNLDAVECPWNIVASLAQQAAEKMLKAFLDFKGVNIPRSHDLPLLLNLAKAYDPGLGLLKEEAQRLSHHATNTRYPGVANAYDEAIAREAVEDSKRICETIADALN